MTKNIIEKLQEQVRREAMASAEYTTMASWCEVKGYQYSADFLYEHAKEEREHMLKLMHYINDRGGYALHPDIKDIKQDYTSLKEIFEIILKKEQSISYSIHTIVATCLQEQDYTTFNFMQWYVNEQREEEVLAKRALELFEVIGEQGVGLYMIDKAIGKLHKWVESKI